ncbi:MAG: hypothetical protein AAGF90_24010 [Pseudomonadota bacterium]
MTTLHGSTESRAPPARALAEAAWETSMRAFGASAFLGHDLAAHAVGEMGVSFETATVAMRHRMQAGPVFEDGQNIEQPGGRPILTIKRHVDDGGVPVMLLEEART